MAHSLDGSSPPSIGTNSPAVSVLDQKLIWISFTGSEKE